MVRGRRLAKHARESFFESEVGYLFVFHVEHLGCARIAAQDAPVFIVGEDAFADRFEGLLPNLLSSRERFYQPRVVQREAGHVRETA